MPEGTWVAVRLPIMIGAGAGTRGLLDAGLVWAGSGAGVAELPAFGSAGLAGWGAGAGGLAELAGEFGAGFGWAGAGAELAAAGSFSV